jgi:hypothetical protein
MAQGYLKGVGGGASGILSGAAAVATVVGSNHRNPEPVRPDYKPRQPQSGGGSDTGTTAGQQSDRGSRRGGTDGEAVARRARGGTAPS